MTLVLLGGVFLDIQCTTNFLRWSLCRHKPMVMELLKEEVLSPKLFGQ